MTDCITTCYPQDQFSRPCFKYIQPQRREAFKPRHEWQTEKGEMEKNTIYRRSYLDLDPNTMASYKQTPIRPVPNLDLKTNEKLEKNTVQKLSYPGHFCVDRRGPIFPTIRSYGTDQRMEHMTTQKHDYIPKPMTKATPITPPSNLMTASCPFTKDTTARLSYLSPDWNHLSRQVPFLPRSNQIKTNDKMEENTTQRLSYLPQPTQTREIYPWAIKPAHLPPDEPFGKDTTYKLSYIPNCATERLKISVPMPEMDMLHANEPFAKNTVYRESYFEPGQDERVKPFKPVSSFQKQPGDARMAADTIYRLTYLGNYNQERRMPIMPCIRGIGTKEPMANTTVQRLSYVDKPIVKVAPVRPTPSLYISSIPISSETTNRLSYQIPEVKERVRQFKPVVSIYADGAPMESNTTQRLSYMPVSAQVKERLPWAEKAAFVRPTEQMEQCTVQKLSFQPPGQFVQDGAFEDCANQERGDAHAHIPKAADY